MKRILAFLLALLLICGAALSAVAFPATEDGRYKDETYGIAKGYVRTKEVIKDAEGVNTITRTYNKQGKMVKETEVQKNGGYTNKTTHKLSYDKKGNLTGEVYSLGDYTANLSYTYTKEGKVAKVVTEDNNGVQIVAYTYNKVGKVIKETGNNKDIDESNSIQTWTTTFSYDKNGNITKKSIDIKYRYGSIEKYTYAWAYNEKNLCVKKNETMYVPDIPSNSGRDVTTYTYDKKGNKIKEVLKSTRKDGSKRSIISLYSYDADGNCIKRVMNDEYDDFRCKTTITYEYKAGKLVKEVTVYKSESFVDKTVERYTYDKAGNLTKYVNVHKDSSGPSSKDVTTYTYQKIGA